MNETKKPQTSPPKSQTLLFAKYVQSMKPLNSNQTLENKCHQDHLHVSEAILFWCCFLDSEVWKCFRVGGGGGNEDKHAKISV